jgi:uncharacterized protein YerC
MVYTLLYNDINIDRISFGSPYKKKKEFFIRDEKIVKSVYYIDISYDDADMGQGEIYIRIPKSEIKYIKTDNCYFRSNDFFSTFIEPLEQYIIDAVYTNSEKWFGGKSFSQEKISKCLVSNMYSGCKLCITNKEAVQKLNCDLYIHLKELQFIDNRFTYNLILIDKKKYKKISKDDEEISKGDEEISKSDEEISYESDKEISYESEFTDEYYKE